MNNITYFHSPDAFMFSEFEIHASIFHKKNMNDYFMISSGTNQFPLSKIWKQVLYQEIETDYLYRWYTSAEGFQTATRTLKIYEDYLASKGDFFPKSFKNDICMTIGGSGAASLVFDYLKKKYLDCEIVLVGMNYSLYERLAQKHGFQIKELNSFTRKSELPKLNDFKEQNWSNKKKVFVFSNPNNPTGSKYQLPEFEEIVKYIKALDGFIVWDKVCDLVISQKEYVYYENVITQNISWSNAAIVNSFSKTDAIAGFRIGYIYGNKEIIKVVSGIQAESIMNPPTFPVFVIALTCMFRCMYLNKTNSRKQYKEILIRNLFRNIFFYTGAIIPNSMQIFAKAIFGEYGKYYNEYITEMIENENAIISNYLLTLEMLNPFILEYTEMQGGFNFCVWFNKPFKLSEIELVQQLINNTGIAILTESSFTICNKETKEYFIRFSTACDPIEYRKALCRMKNYFQKEGVFVD